MNYIATVISNRSNRYIHLYWIGPPTFASNGRCMGRCSIESKNDERNIISSLHSVSTIFVSSLSMWSTFNLLGQTKTIKLLLTWLKTKHNITVLWYNIMQFFTRKTQGCNILFNSANKEIFLVFFVPVIMWQEMTVTVKKESFTSIC
jgi:hypothetical protein